MKLGSIILLSIGVFIAGGLLFPTVPHCGPSRETSITQSRLSQLSTGMGLYKQEYGSYPEPIDNFALLACLGGANPRQLNFYKPAQDDQRDGQLIDAWKHEIYIRHFGDARQLRSAGKDGIYYTKDDILHELGRLPQK